MNTQETLQALQNDIDEILHIVDKEFVHLSDAQLMWKPAPEKWSIAECLLHLNLVNGYYIKKIESKIEELETTKLKKKDSFSLSFNGKIFVNYILDPQAKYKFKAPKQVKPKKDIDVIRVKTRFIDLLKTARNQMDKADKFDLDKIKINSPFTNLLKFRLGDVFIITVRHSRRHINQALRVKESEGFPTK